MREIDAVITWVDGHCPEHVMKRARYDTSKLHPESATALRWEQDDEIVFLLRSLERYAPWLRRVIIVTDEQAPPIYGVSSAFKRKITVVDHKVIFRGYERCLPTFNSVTINSAIHRIPGLSNQFIYFNDDIVLTEPMNPEDFFIDGKIVIRGRFTTKMRDGILFTAHRENAAKLLGIPMERFFRSAHMCIPMLRDLVEGYYSNHGDVFEKNISHRFRSADQYLPSALNTHLAIQANRAIIRLQKDWIFITAIDCQSGDRDLLRKKINKLRNPKINMACINDLTSAKKTLRSAEWRIAKAVEDDPVRTAFFMFARYWQRFRRHA